MKQTAMRFFLAGALSGLVFVVGMLGGASAARAAASPPTIYWTDWETGDFSSGFVGLGTITTPTSTVEVTYTNPQGIAFFQPSGGTDYYANNFFGLSRDPATSPYTSFGVANIPTGTDIVALRYAGTQTLTFSEEIANLVFAYVSLNGNGYGFNQDFEILSFGDPSDGNDCGYWGCGTSYKNVVDLGGGIFQYQLLGTGEPHGTIRFLGAFSTLTWQSLSNEYWNGFTVGVQGTATEVSGCADGEREGFTDLSTYPNIAGCSGAWTMPGIHTLNPGTAPECPGLPTFDTLTPACERNAGDDSTNPSGQGCNVADLCAPGWHVCASAAEVAAASPTGCVGATESGDPSLFFATRQSGPGFAQCSAAQTASDSNDVFGCGNFGAAPDNNTCSPLDRFSNNFCTSLAGSPWSCDDLSTTADNNGECEAYTVTKSGVSHGGVLCCRDPENQPPDCSAATASPAMIWPPNHKMVPIAITGVTDPDGDAVTIIATGVQQDEAVRQTGVGSGNTAPDASLSPLAVRAERNGNPKSLGNGRVYHISFNAVDGQGGQCAGTVKVCVAHDQGKGSTCVDGGPLYNSLAP